MRCSFLLLVLIPFAADAGEFNKVLKIGDAAPAWKDLPGTDGKKHSLADHASREVLVVCFTCNSCACSEEYEDRLIAFAKKYQDRIAFVAINVNTIPEDRLDAMKKKAEKKKFPFEYLYDETQKIAKDYGATYTPEFFVLTALVTLGAAEVAKGLADNWDWIKGPVGILLTMQAAPGEFFFFRREPYYYVALGMVVAMIVISLVLERSRLGQHFLAVREDEAAAEASGVDTYRAKTVAIGLSAALTAFAGSFYAQFYLYVSPDTVLTFEPQLTMMLGTMVGGAGTALGPVLGSVLFSGLGEALRNLPFENTRQVVIGSKLVYAILLIVILIYLPGGLITLGRRKA